MVRPRKAAATADDTVTRDYLDQLAPDAQPPANDLWTARMEAARKRKATVDKARNKADIKPPIVVVPAVELLPDLDQRLDDLDALADRAAENVGMEPGLVALAVASFDHEAAQFEDTARRLVDELNGRGRFLVFAAAAQEAGHQPASAYCYIADRFDPWGGGEP